MTPRTPASPPAAGAEPAPEAPCEPCKAAAEARQFSLNPPVAPAISDHAVPVITPVVTTRVGDDGVDLSVDGSERSFSLNATAGLIWLTIDGRLDIAEMIAELATETGAPADLIGPDVRRSIATFADQGLITLAART